MGRCLAELAPLKIQWNVPDLSQDTFEDYKSSHYAKLK